MGYRRVGYLDGLGYRRVGARAKHFPSRPNISRHAKHFPSRPNIFRRQFFNILSWVCFKRGVYFAKVNPNYTSQTCPNCGVNTAESWRCRLTSRQTFQDGKKDLSERIHKCPDCGFEVNRDIASAMVICTRGQRGIENACGVDVTGILETVSSQLALKQEIFGANRGISLCI